MKASIPESLRADILTVVDNLKSKLGDELKSIVLSGGLVKNKLIKETDRVQLMIVVNEVNIALLDLTSESLTDKRAKQINATVLTESDLKSSTDVFPIRFLDMQQDYEVLHGEDVVKNLSISRDNLRLRCEQELKNLLLKQRRSYLAIREDSKAMEAMLLRGYYTFMQSGDALAELITGNVYRNDDEVLKAIGEIGLDVDLMKRISALRSGETLGDAVTVKQTVGEFMAMIEKAARMADKL